MRKICVFTLGCKVNQYESRSLISDIENAGYLVTGNLERADAYIINTCSVTAEADKKSRQCVARAQRLNETAPVYIMGCSSQNAPEKFSDKKNVRYIAGVSGKSAALREILTDIENYYIKDSSGAAERDSFSPPQNIFEIESGYNDEFCSFPEKTRGYIKVQDGCNNFCSYCIIPYLRGRSRSRGIESILKDADALSKTCKEIVIVGIDLSSFGKDCGSSLSALVGKMGAVDARKRLGSLECEAVTDELLTAMKDSGFCPHFHLSLQSGSESVLKRMNRRYTPAYYLDKVALIRQYFPDAGITTDVIAGFSGETEAEHLETIETVRKAGFSDMHVFPYSPRKGTKAFGLPDVSPEIKKRRAAELISVKDELKSQFLSGQIGKTVEVYAEKSVDTGVSEGFSDNYIRVYSSLAPGQIGKVKLTGIYLDGMTGEII